MRKTLSVLAVITFAACDCGGGGGGGKGAGQAPVLDAIGARSVEELQPLSFAVHATDTAGSTLTLSASGVPVGATFDGAGGDGTFSWRPGAGTAGSYSVVFQVSDGAKTDQEEVQITVTANTAPVLDPIGSKVVHELEALSFAVHATDTTGSTLTLSASGLPEGATFDHTAGDGTFTWTPAAGAFGGHQVTFTVSDGDKEDQEVVQVTVLHPAPVEATFGPASFLQFIENQDPDGEQRLAGAANFWDLDRDFALLDGGDDQFDGALELHVGTGEGPGTDPAFPLDQSYADLYFVTPEVGAADGLAPVALDARPWVASGDHAAWLNGTYLTQLYQDVDLTGVAPPITLSFDYTARTGQGAIPSPYDEFMVNLRSTSGAFLHQVAAETDNAGHRTFSLDDHAGQAVRVSFELAGGAYDQAGIDNVSVQYGGGEHLVNGGFETGDLTGWQTAVVAQSQNVESGSRVVGGLEVTRTFYTLPTLKWARWVDVFENTGSTTISTSASYLSVLGAGSASVVVRSDDGRSISAFDGASKTRDVGWVFGGTAELAPAVTYTSATALDGTNGSPDVWVVFPITIPPGGKVAIVNYLVLTGVDTGSLPGTSVATHPADVEAVNAAIVGGYGIDPAYQDYLTTTQLGAVLNF